MREIEEELNKELKEKINLLEHFKRQKRVNDIFLIKEIIKDIKKEIEVLKDD